MSPSYFGRIVLSELWRVIRTNWLLRERCCLWCDWACLRYAINGANVDASAHVDTTHYVDASARKSGIVKPLRIIDKGDRRQA